MGMIGRTLGPFTIQSLIGAGGMGEVYRARDRKLDRDVAIKVLPAAWMIDPERRARFDREARLLAALNHSNIGAIYGVEDADDTRALVLELVEGPTLADRLEAGSLPLKEALQIASQVAAALDAAHQSGIVHRDLKPANIKIRPDGQVKVLDFGLAKIAGEDAPPAVTRDATTILATREGAVMGTAAYMSPEQARGVVVDKRSDIWAFGCILFELLTGRVTFHGATWSDTIASILQREPDWAAVPAATPVVIQRLLRRCLEKDVSRRLRDIGDARADVEDAMTTGASVATLTVRDVRGVSRSSVAAIALAAAIVGAALAWMTKPSAVLPPSAVTRLNLAIPDGDALVRPDMPSLAISPDGRTIVYGAARGGRQPGLFVRHLDSDVATPLADTEGGMSPFFSPDGRWIGFFAQGKLRKVLATGGGVQTLCDAAFGIGGSWSGDDTVYFAPFNTSGIWKVSAAGGVPTEFSHVDRRRGEVSHRWPQVLDDNKTVLFTVWTGPGLEERDLDVQVGNGDHRRLVAGASTGRYMPSGHLLYSKAEALIAVPFDRAALKVTGNPVTLADRPSEAEAEGAHYTVSASGTIAYVAASADTFDRRLVWVNRDGSVQAIPAPPKAYTDPALSPDGRLAAVSVQGPTQTLWIYDFARSTLTTLPAIGSSQAPLWTADGRRLIYRATKDGTRNLFWRSADGSGDEERLSAAEGLETPGSVTPDGTLLLFSRISSKTTADLHVIDLQPPHASRPSLDSRFREASPRLSPDGRWLAYASDESGQLEVYVRPFPSLDAKLAISTGGGTEPRWSADGREIFYRNENTMMAVPLTMGGPMPGAGAPRALFEDHFQFTDTGVGGYDVARDGRFLMIQPPSAKPFTHVTVVLNWLDDLKAAVSR